MTNDLEKLIKNYGKELQILYVEDNEAARIATLSILKKYFSKIDVCVDGLDGLRSFQNNKYDVIITDLDMPNMDGLQMISEIRHMDKDIYIVIFSTYNDTEYFIESINLGVDGYILKPFNIKQFFQMAIKMMEHFISNQTTCVDHNIITLFDGYIWNKTDQSLYKDDQKVKLSKNETLFISCLTNDMEQTISSNTIGEFIFENYSEEDSIKLRNLISKLKNKVNPELIESTYGLGYKLKKQQ